MLEKVLQEIRSGGTIEARALAARLGTSPALIEMMLEHLQNAGYIQPYQACGDGCGSCSLKDGCHQQPQLIKIWQSSQQH